MVTGYVRGRCFEKKSFGADRSFDAVTMGYGLRNVSSIPRALQELRRVMRPGARAAILDFNNTDNLIADSFQVS